MWHISDIFVSLIEYGFALSSMDRKLLYRNRPTSIAEFARMMRAQLRFGRRLRWV